MFNLVKKTLLTGVGVAALTKEKLEEIAKDFVEKGKMTEQEGRTLVDDLVTRSEESRAELQKQIEGKVECILGKMDLVKKSEVDALKLEIEELRQALPKKDS
jgi:polyhydroxyalkanoate synthesis regulator phasin